MTQPAATIDAVVVQRSVDQRMTLRDVSWNDYQALLAIRGDHRELLPQVDPELVESLLQLPTQTAAVRALRARLRTAGESGSPSCAPGSGQHAAVRAEPAPRQPLNRSGPISRPI